MEVLKIALLLVVAMIVSQCECGTAQAQGPAAVELPDISQPCATDIPEPERRAVIAHDGLTGIWFHGEVARCMLGRLAALPLYASRVRLLEERIAVDEHRIASLWEAADLSIQAEERATGALEAAERRARQAEEDQPSRALWAGLGAAAVVVVEVVALLLWSRLGPD